MKEFTGTMTIQVEVTLKAKSKKVAEKMFEDLFPNVSIENDGELEIDIIDERNNLDDTEWEIQAL